MPLNYDTIFENMVKYSPQKIEKKWQKYWEAKKFYVTKDKVAGKENKMLLTEFAYPSGNLHIGHWYAFSLPDIKARYLRMKGYNVLYPTGFDAFGLPAENAAIKHNIHPEKWTKQNIAYMTRQLKSMGTMFDWSRKVSTIDPDYYAWTQWMFIEFYKKGLAYRAITNVNWCPNDKTVLANEQVVDGKCDRCKSEVTQKELAQWMFKITEFKDELIDGLKNLDWQETAKLGQINWVGRSQGATIKFQIPNYKSQINPNHQNSKSKNEFVEVFTTRPDTIFGATAIVISPEIAQKWLSIGWQASSEVKSYVKKSLAKRELEREEAKEKTGIDAGIFAVNPINNQKIPVWVADYVLGHYGTGAVMFVPAHDQRDFEFAKKYNLPVKEVVLPEFGQKKPNAIFRDSVAAIVTRSSDDKILLVLNKKNNEWAIPGGGRDSNDDDVTTLTREVKEETGYTDFEIKEYLGQISTNFFASARNVERTKFQKAYHVILKNENSIPLKPDAHEDMELHWMNAQESIKKLDSNTSISYESEFVKRFLQPSLVCFSGNGVLVNSGKFDGMDSQLAKKKIVEELKSKGVGNFQKTYRLRDWILSRQRYWGVPIPMIHCPACGYVPVSQKELPVKLPPLKDFKPADDGRSPLAKATKWLNVTCPTCKGPAQRETDTMDTFVDSSWYFMRYTDPKNKKAFASKEKMKQWLPVFSYLGGAEHTTMHLLYARFFAKALHKLGYVNASEPFLNRRNRGIILGPDNQKMSKSRGNVVDPDQEVKKYGADAVRMYLAFMGPYLHGGPWNPGGITGVYRFLNRVWNFVHTYDVKVKPSSVAASALNNYTHKIGIDIGDLSFNTGVSNLMKLLNEIESHHLSKQQYETFLKLLAPFAPHVAEELWQSVLKNKKSIHLQTWPVFDKTLVGSEKLWIMVQVNGKVRDKLEVAGGVSQKDVEKMAEESAKIKPWIEGKQVRKIIFVPNKLINIVI